MLALPASTRRPMQRLVVAHFEDLASGPARFIGAALLGLPLRFVEQSNDILDRPKPISHASRHRRSDPKALVDAAEIVVDEVEIMCACLSAFLL